VEKKDFNDNNPIININGEKKFANKNKNELFLEILYKNQEKKEYIIDEQNIKVSYLNDGYIECKFRILNEKYLNNF
jgi:hypothetical protein